MSREYSFPHVPNLLSACFPPAPTQHNALLDPSLQRLVNSLLEPSGYELVRNIVGTGEHKCGCGSWLSHWSRFSREAVPNWCPVEGCLNRPAVGAHVRKYNHLDTGWYVMPLCAPCNTKREILRVAMHVPLIPVTLMMGCG